MKYFELTNREKPLNIEEFLILENEIIDASSFVWIEPTIGKEIGKIGNDIVFHSIADGCQIVSLGNNPVKAYAIYELNYGMRYLLELQSNPLLKSKGYGTQLLVYLTKHQNGQGRLMIDKLLSVASASMIEKLISSKLVSAHVAYFDRGVYEPYDPDNINDQQIPMYDKTIFVAPNRPITQDTEEALSRTWVLENWSPARKPLLQKIRRVISTDNS
jgi:hypothetical protein